MCPPVSGPTVSVGTRGVWRGVPYVEIVIHPSRAVFGSAGCEVLAGVSIELSWDEPTPSLPEEAEFTASADVVDAFVNPADALRLHAALRLDAASKGGFETRPYSSAPAVTPRFRISVSRDGIYRLDHAYLTSHGLSAAGLDPRKLHLTSRGFELPIVIEGEADGSLDPGDAVVFYGQALTGENQPRFNGGDYTDVNVYWLYADTVAGLRMTSVAGGPVNGYPQVTQVTSTVRAEINDFFSIVGHFRPNGDVWFMKPFYGCPVSCDSSAAYTAILPHTASPNATVAAKILGFGVVDCPACEHRVHAELNDSPPLTGPDPATWAGAGLVDQSWTFASLVEGNNTIKLTAPGWDDHADYQIADYFDVTYSRTLEADAGAIEFETAAAAASYAPSGFASLPLIFDVSARDVATGLSLPIRVTGAAFAASAATFELPAGAGTRVLALSAAPLVPDDMVAGSGRDLSNQNLSADFVILTHPDFHPAVGDSAWKNFLLRRRASLDVEVVDIQDVYDNYSDGIFDPAAIRAFFLDTTNWRRVPRYALLIGDGTYDYKDYMNQQGSNPAYKNWVPTMMFEDLTDSTYFGRFASDGWYADADEDGYPDLAVGRIPVRSYAVLEGVLQKIAAYEDQALAGTWYKTGGYVADTYCAIAPVDPDPKCVWEKEDFEGYNDFLQATYTTPPWINSKVYFHDPPYNGTDADACAAAIRPMFANSALIHYSGHGGVRFWGNNLAILSADPVRSGQSDIDLLPVSTQLPFVVNSTCYISAFDQVSAPSLMEDALSRSDRGLVGATGWTTIAFPPDEHIFSTALFEAAFGRPKTRVVGDLVETGRFALPSSYFSLVFSMNLLGDPTLRLRMPAPPPPIGLTATPGDRTVTLDWTSPGSSVVAYHVYRGLDGTAWTRLTASPIAAPTYTDSGLTNAKTYWYYVSSIDIEGFEGPPSIQIPATPLNLIPPAAPTGLAVYDLGTGDSLLVSWNPNTEWDLASYTLAYGTAPGSHPNSLTIPPTATSSTVSGLTQDVTYYFVLRATNTSNTLGAPSAEVAGTPTTNPTGGPFAIRPPAKIEDLRVTRSGSDLILTWSRPTLDVTGQPVTVVSYQLYRVVGLYDWNLDLVPYGADDAVVAIPDPATETYTDTGAASLGDPVTYLLVALNQDGDRSAASNPPPAAILTLSIRNSLLTPGRTLVFFQPVTRTNVGGLAQIQGYRLYGFFPMISERDHVAPDPARQVFLANLPASLPTCELTAFYCDDAQVAPLYYTVIAVDNRGNTSLY